MQMFGMVEENSPEVGNVLVNRMIKAGQTIHIPTGLQHFRYGCWICFDITCVCTCSSALQDNSNELHATSGTVASKFLPKMHS